MMTWEERPYMVLASCKATVRDPGRIFTGWPRNVFSEHPNVPWRYAVMVDTPRGLRWVLAGNKRQPKPGETVRLSTSPHTGAPLGYDSQASLEVAARLTNHKTLTGTP